MPNIATNIIAYSFVNSICGIKVENAISLALPPTITAVITYANINPIQALVYSAVINGVLSVPMLLVIMKISNDKKVLKDRTNGRISNILGWLTLVVNGLSVLYMIFMMLG